MTAEVWLAGGVAAAAFFLVTAFLGRGAGDRRRREELLARVRGEQLEGAAKPKSRALFDFRKRRPTLALRRPQQGYFARFGGTLVRAGIPMQPGQFILLVVVIAVGLGFAGSTRFGQIGMLGGFTLGLVGGRFFVRRRIGKRRTKINLQLNDLLQVVAGGLSAGQSFLQALASASKEVGEPIGSEIQIMLSEVELGSTVEVALERFRVRIGDQDMDLVIDAVLIQRRVGGNLAEVLTNIAWTIRERIRIRGEVKSLTGQARMSGWLLSALPIGLAGILTSMNPEYMAALYETNLGRSLLAGGAIGQVIGFLVIQKIANVKV